MEPCASRAISAQTTSWGSNVLLFFQDKDIYLLDDPLAAVDAHVAQHIFDRCIMGVLRDKTRILCTHHVHFLQQADLVVVMNDGHIVKSGGRRPQSVL